MVSYDVEEHGDRLVITLDPGEPVGLGDLADSFASLARMYERHYRSNDEAAPKLFVTRLETGSVIAEIAPYGIMMGGIALMDGGMIVTDFANRVWRGISYFSGKRDEVQKLEPPTKEDAADLKEFMKPLTGKTGARLGVKHARYDKIDGDKRTVVEYNFDEAEINKASINMEQAIALPAPKVVPDPTESGIRSEVMLFLEQANRGPGKEKGRTGDRGRIPEVSDKILPVYFRQSIQDLKEKMMQGEENPLNLVFVVDVHVQRIDGDPKGYTVVEIHESNLRDE
ncbi:hypothetical protein GE300_13860 [Rhodobacteraceae bacterium 2CG4]|uniref:Uncharacterized protein n=1 Tax=Halovulum marinum TaxID=2662447 RepID=A0A6L5Z2D2_9RHOB|nr:hypothetical protein [Halovulum marinum]MSU90687.1 hypothetical protein [Halovulum marinum]